MCTDVALFPKRVTPFKQALVDNLLVRNSFRPTLRFLDLVLCSAQIVSIARPHITAQAA
jgi:hypothetical protein